MNNRFFQPRRCGGVEGLWGAAMAETAAQGPTAGAARVGKCLFVASLNKWHTALSFPEVCSFIPAWLLFQASCMRSFSFLPATAILLRLRGFVRDTDYGRPVRKSPSLHGRKLNHNPKFLGTAKAYFLCHFGPIFQISLIYAFIGCP